MLGQMRGHRPATSTPSLGPPLNEEWKMRRRAVYSPNGELMSFQSPDSKKTASVRHP